MEPGRLSHELREEWREDRALCACCQVATLAPLASVALAAWGAR